MRKPLTQNNIKALRYQCRMGYILPAMLFVIGTVISVVVFETRINSKDLNFEMILIMAFGMAGLSFFIGYKMNWKYISDIRNKEKQIETKIIQSKASKKDFEAGSGTLVVGQDMNEFYSYSIVVENIRYRVDEKLFSSCSDGDELLFNYAPKSRYLMKIELKH